MHIKISADMPSLRSDSAILKMADESLDLPYNDVQEVLNRLGQLDAHRDVVRHRNHRGRDHDQEKIFHNLPLRRHRRVYLRRQLRPNPQSYVPPPPPIFVLLLPSKPHSSLFPTHLPLLPTAASMGCSGALFGLIGCLLVDLIQNWRLILKPWWELAKLVILTLISFAFGLLPWLDNFAHIGGFFTGMFAGILLIPAIHFSKAHRLGIWIARIISLPILVCIFYFGITNFYSGKDPAAVSVWILVMLFRILQ
ncbi:hypothetical protein BC938DRAFT_471124 [Jimgerdemannia flammicorona]|uniref:Peptidase S54 rhomboid domain-containing protein n=1 Tax=Jimgerdemannia flammicorona TaxID=994334 RepID=A0A433Q8U7_9FUNG|nr:hypothetical protein BC938DRAFT_471124 [Jimgerdemannia flammicorona]